MGRPLTQEDIEMLDEHFKNIGQLPWEKKIIVFLPSIILVGWVVYYYNSIII
jgi:hypothetical protein